MRGEIRLLTDSRMNRTSHFNTKNIKCLIRCYWCGSEPVLQLRSHDARLTWAVRPGRRLLQVWLWWWRCSGLHRCAGCLCRLRCWSPVPSYPGQPRQSPWRPQQKQTTDERLHSASTHLTEPFLTAGPLLGQNINVSEECLFAQGSCDPTVVSTLVCCWLLSSSCHWHYTSCRISH